MDSLDYKLNTLSIEHMTDDIYHEHLRPLQLIGVDVSEHKYYKMYGDTPMFYSAEYLNRHSLEELIQSDKENKERFCPSFFKRIWMKIEGIRLKVYLLYKKYT